MAWTYERRYIRCGKQNCSQCTNGVGHGPYWYGFQRVDGKVKSKYFGKQDPREADAETVRKTESAPTIPSRYARPKRMDWMSALRIMGFASRPNIGTLKTRYRVLMLEHHPDHGGNVEIATSINLAYQYLTT